MHIIEVFGRIFISALFIIEAIKKFFNPDISMMYMSDHGVPEFLFYPSIAFELIVPLFLIDLGTEYIKRRIADFKSLGQGSRWPLYILLFGVWDLMIGFAYLLFSYFEITHVTMIIANGLFITGTYLTFLSFGIAKKLQLSRNN